MTHLENDRKENQRDLCANIPDNIANTASDLGYEVGSHGDMLIYENLTDDSALDRQISYSVGAYRNAKNWLKTECTIRQFLGWAGKHEVGPKDGQAFLQGVCSNKSRAAANMQFFDLAGIDIDNGASVAPIVETLLRNKITALLYTTHSHMKESSSVGKKAFLKWAKDTGSSSEATAERLGAFLVASDKMTPEIAATITDVEETETAFNTRHAPMPKCRVIFPLKERFGLPDKAKAAVERQSRADLWEAGLDALADMLGVVKDESCKDLPRLFYRARHAEGAPFEVHAVLTDTLLDFEALATEWAKRHPKKSANTRGAGPRPASDGGGGKRKTITKHGDDLWSFGKDWRIGFQAADAVRELAPEMVRDDKGGKIEITCPFDAHHSNPGDPADRGCVVMNGDKEAGKEFSIKCQHNACADRKSLEFLCEMIDQDCFAESPLRAERYALNPPGEQTHFPSLSKGLDFFNGFLAKVTFPNTVKIAMEFVPEGKKQREVSFLNESSARLALAKYQFMAGRDKDGKPIWNELFPAWRSHAKAREFKLVTFDPSQESTALAATPNEPFNLWGGFAIDPDATKRWELLKRHILLHVCAGDFDHALWVFSWFAQALQDPRNTTATALVIRSDKGMGKSTLGIVLKEIFGRHFVSIAERDQLVGKFNAHLAESVIVVAEEAVWSKDHRAANKLKDMIANPFRTIEMKGVDAVSNVPNCSRLIFLSNEEHIIPATKDERRYMCLEMVPPAPLRDPRHKAYFDALYAEIEAGAASAMMAELAAFPYDRVDLRRAPITAMFHQQVSVNLSDEQEWFLGVLEEGDFLAVNQDSCVDADKWEDEEITVESRLVFASYGDKVRGYNSARGSETACGNFLMKIPGVRRERIADKTLFNDVKRHRCFVLPSLKQLRAWAEAEGLLLSSNAPGMTKAEDALSDLDSVAESDDRRYLIGREMEITCTLAMIFDALPPVLEWEHLCVPWSRADFERLHPFSPLLTREGVLFAR